MQAVVLSEFSLDNKIVSKENRVLYGVIQKNASTSVLAAFNKLYYGDNITGTPYQMMDAIPKNNKVCKLSLYSPGEVDEILQDPHFYKVTTLRDPYQRFVSAYMTKLINMPDFVNTYGITNDMIVNLHNAIEFISNTPDQDREMHFRSQYLLGDFETIKYKRVMHVRRLYHNWNLFRKDKPGIPKLGNVRNKTEASDFIQVLNNYHPHVKTRIMNLYPMDYQLFTEYQISV